MTTPGITTFRDSIRRLSPRWLSHGNAEKLLYAIGVHLDALGDAAVAAIAARFPNFYTPETLAITGRERGIRRGFVETDAGYAERLRVWWDTQKHRGNPYSLMRQVQGLLAGHLVPMAVVNNSGAWYTLDAAGVPGYHPTTAWNWDGDTRRWSRFWLILYPPNTLWTPTVGWGSGDVWGSNTFGDPDTQVTWGSTARLNEVNQIRALVSEWQAPHARCQNIIVAWNTTVFRPDQTAPPLPDGTWHNYAKIVSGAYVRSRDPSAIYWSVFPEVTRD